MLKKRLFFICLSLLIFFNILSICLLCYNAGKNSFVKQTSALLKQSGKIMVTVLEESTLKPIDNATVCIIETRHYENTNKHGKTNYISVPILPNTNFNMTNQREYGELTILVYKSGYSDYLSFYNMISPGFTNVGIVIKLKPIINKEDTFPTIDVKYPDTSWCEKLIKLYKKNN